ncbi:PAS domain-containing protein [Tenacibaculum aiptasiae]|uniref:PAS domain-containing protein n=1 Tax=Tenacibaculum aiptasiae TaxID=426481 RepID=UPI003B5C0BAB
MKNDLNDMMCLDTYLSSLDDDKYKETSSLINQNKTQSINLLSWGIQDLFTVNTLADDLKHIHKLANNFDWGNNFNSILKENSYESLVITNSNKQIIWVNSGFKKMTGYDNEFAIGKSPVFLQGEKTTDTSREKIRKKLLKNKPFKEVIINYKKDRSTYKCELKIFPLYAQNETTHFLALEKEVV